MVICDVLRGPTRRRRVYNQLILLMSVADLVYSLAFSLTTMPLPSYDEYGNDWKIYGTAGNDATCTAQGFFLLSFGASSLFFNVSLSAYYVLVFVFEWRELPPERRVFSKWTPLFALPIALGLILGVAGIPYYGVVFFGCHVLRAPVVTNNVPGWLLNTLPSIGSLALATLLTMVVFWRVRKEDWMANTSPSSSSGHEIDNALNKERIQRIRREVVWQSVFYLSAFYTVWPLLIVVQFDEGGGPPSKYYLYLATFVIWPIQGLLNAIVYFRPRIWRYAERRRRTRQQQQRERSRRCPQHGETDAEATDTHTRQTNGARHSGADAGAAAVCRYPESSTSHDDDEEATGIVRSVESIDLDSRIEPSALIACDIVEEMTRLQLIARDAQAGAVTTEEEENAAGTETSTTQQHRRPATIQEETFEEEEGLQRSDQSQGAAADPPRGSEG